MGVGRPAVRSQRQGVVEAGGLRRGAGAVAVAIVLLVAVGIAERIHPAGLRRFDLDQEGTVSAAFSALLDAFAGLAILLVWLQRKAGRLVLFLAPAFVYVALDEVFSFHERLETATGVNSNTWLSPLVVLGALGYLGVLRDWRSWRPAQVLITVGGLFWFVSQVLELVGHSVLFYGDTRLEAPHYAWWMVSEEFLEMSGSACFLFAGLYVLRSGGPVFDVVRRQGSDLRARWRPD